MSETLLSGLVDTSIQAYAKDHSLEISSSVDYQIVTTKDPSYGDFACNVAFKLAKLARQKPRDIAQDLVALIQRDSESKQLDRVEVAGGGFINFYLAKTSLAEVLFEVQKKKDQYGESDFGKGKKTLLEFVSANPTGPLTIAHGRQAAVGDCLARILKATGHAVESEYYLNDAGRQMNLLGASLFARYQQELGKQTELPEEGYQGIYLVELAKKLVEQKKEMLLKEPEQKALEYCRAFAKDEMMKMIQGDLDHMRVHFHTLFSESTLYKEDAVEKALADLKKGNHLFNQDGALWFRSTDLGDDKDRVVKKSTGDYTYLAPDIAYHRNKFERDFQWLINFWGPDHHGYIPRMKAACQALGHKPDQLDVRIVQLTTLYRKGEPVRMSTRAGEFVTLQELLDEVGVDATRFFFIMRRIESHLDFDLDLAKQKSQDNPVYYLQYAHARVAGLIRYAEREVTLEADVSKLQTQEETDVIKRIHDFPKALVQASQAMEPYRLADYLRELAASFHKFYSKHRIVGEDEALMDARLLLADSVRIVLRNGLELLGISQPESM